MTASKHTPGPWGIDNLNFDIVNAEGGLIAHTSPAAATDTVQQSANAALIAKAWLIPELVEALKSLLTEPDTISLYDEEGIEGWNWDTPLGEFNEIGDWGYPPKLPEELVRLARSVLSKTEVTQ